MKERLLKIIRDNTKNGEYKQSTIVNLSRILKISKVNILELIKKLLDNGSILKVTENPVFFIDRYIFENMYKTKIKDNSINDIDTYISLLSSNPQDFKKLIGWDRSLSQLVEQCKATISYPPNGLPMMLHGETGTGKSLIAKLSYEYAKNHNLLQKEKRFVSINCSEYANNPELLTANLFGYVKGAFTGADRDVEGLISLADGGVLFLDEVHNLKGECQEKLFQFMDQSTYHRVGDNKTWYTSQVRLIVATTEEPDKVLLRTLLRRIPMIIEIPSLENRGLQEKIEILHHIFNLEQTRLNIKIKMSSQVYNLLISSKYDGNIGGLKSVIQSCCINSLFQINSLNEMEITLKNLPENFLKKVRIEKIVANHTEEFIYVDNLVKITGANDRIIKLCEGIINLYTEKDDQQFYDRASKKILEYLDERLIDGNMQNKTDFYNEGIRHILQLVNMHYHLELSNNNILAMSRLFIDFMHNAHVIAEWSREREDNISIILEKLKNDNLRLDSISVEIINYFENYLDMKLSNLELIMLLIFLQMYSVTNIIERRSAVILAHGFSTASSIASAANQFLGKYIYDSIDVPLNVDSTTVIKQLNSYISKLNNIEELILLVDMGSLESIYTGLNLRNAKIGIINQVTTSSALEIGSSLLRNETLEVIFDRVANQGAIKYRIENNLRKTPLILCSCMSGMGAAERLREVIMSSLPANSIFKVKSYNYYDLLKNSINDMLFEDGKVICVVGTMNPNIKGLNFIAIEDLVINNDSQNFDEYFKDYLSTEDLAFFKKNILKNFSLSNIMNTLTILNPNKLLEYVTEALENLQNRMKVHLSSKICLGLYMHVCCLIERLILHQDIETYPNIEEFVEKQNTFISNVKDSFKEIEYYYKVQIPTEEIGYIFDYINVQEIIVSDSF